MQTNTKNWQQKTESNATIKPHETVDTSRLLNPTKEQIKENPTKYMLLAPIVLEDVKDCIKRLKN